MKGNILGQAEITGIYSRRHLGRPNDCSIPKGNDGKSRFSQSGNVHAGL